MTRLITATDSAKKSFNSLKLETEDGVLLTFERFSRIAREDVFQALDLLSKNFDKFADKPDVLRSLFTVRQWSTIAPLIKDINGNTKEWIKTYTEGKSVAEGFETQMQSLDKQIEKFKNNIDNMNSGFMDTIKVLSGELLPLLNSAMKYLHDIDNGTVRVTTHTTVFAMEMLIAAGAIRAIIAAMAGSEAAMAGVAFMANPIVLGIVAMAAAASFFYLKMKDIEKVEELRVERLKSIKKETEELVKSEKISKDLADLYMKSIKDFEKYDVSEVWEKTVDLMKDAVSSSEEILSIMQKISDVGSLRMKIQTDEKAPTVLNSDEIKKSNEELKMLKENLDKIKKPLKIGFDTDNPYASGYGGASSAKPLEDSKELLKEKNKIAEVEKKIYKLSTTKEQQLLDIQKEIGEIRNFDYMKESLSYNEKYQTLLKEENQLKSDIQKSDTERLSRQEELNQKLITYNEDLQRQFSIIETATANDFLDLVDPKNLKDLDDYITKTEKFMPTLKATIEDMKGLGLFEGMADGVTELDVVTSKMFNKWAGSFSKFKDISKDIEDTISNGTVEGLEELIRLTEESTTLSKEGKAAKIAEYEIIKQTLVSGGALSTQQVAVLNESLGKIKGMRQEWVDLIMAAVEFNEEIKKNKIFTSDIYDGIDRVMLQRQAELDIMEDGIEKLKEQKAIQKSILALKKDEESILLGKSTYADLVTAAEAFKKEKNGVLNTLTGKIEFTGEHGEKNQQEYNAQIEVIKKLDVLFQDILKINNDIYDTTKDTTELEKDRKETLESMKKDILEQKDNISEQLFILEHINDTEKERTSALKRRATEEMNALIAKLGGEAAYKDIVQDVKNLNEQDFGILKDGTAIQDGRYEQLLKDVGIAEDKLNIVMEIIKKEIEINGYKDKEIEKEQTINTIMQDRIDMYSAILSAIDKITKGESFAPSFNVEGASSFLANMSQGGYENLTFAQEMGMTSSEIDDWKTKDNIKQANDFANAMNFGITQYANIAQQSYIQEANNIQQKISILEMEKSLARNEEDRQRIEEDILRQKLSLIDAQSQQAQQQSVMGGVTSGISSGVMAGVATGVPIVGALIGGLSLLGGLFGASKAKKEAEQQKKMLELQAETNRLLGIQNKNIASIERYQEDGAKFGTAYAKRDWGHELITSDFNVSASQGTMEDRLGMNMGTVIEYSDILYKINELNKTKELWKNRLDAILGKESNMTEQESKDFEDWLTQKTELFNKGLSLAPNAVAMLIIDQYKGLVDGLDYILNGINAAREAYYKEWYGFDVKFNSETKKIEEESFKLRENLLNNFIDNATTSYTNLGKIITNTFSSGLINEYVKENSILSKSLDELEVKFKSFINSQLKGTTQGFDFYTERSRSFSESGLKGLSYFQKDLSDRNIEYTSLINKTEEGVEQVTVTWRETGNVVKDLIDSTSELETYQKNINQLTIDYSNEWVNLGGKISDVADLIGYGIYDGIYKALDETSYVDRFNSLGSTIGSTISEKIKTEFINANFSETILQLNQNVSDYINQDGINISGIQSMAQELQKVTAQTEMDAMRLESLMGSFEIGDMEYINEAQNIQYSTSASQTLQTIYNLNASTNIGNVVSNTSQASINEFVRLLAPTLLQVIKNEL